MSPVRKFILVSLELVKQRVDPCARLLKIARDAIMGDLALQLWPGKSKIFRAYVLLGAARGKNS